MQLNDIAQHTNADRDAAFALLKEAYNSQSIGRVGKQTINMQALQQAWEQAGKPVQLVDLWKVLKKAGLDDQQVQQAFKEIGVPTDSASISGHAPEQTEPDAESPRGEFTPQPISTPSTGARRTSSVERAGFAQRKKMQTIDTIAKAAATNPDFYRATRTALAKAFMQAKAKHRQAQKRPRAQ